MTGMDAFTLLDGACNGCRTCCADQFFQFIINKAKVTSENTITLEAEGDPSTFSMNLTVLRPESGEMMQLVQYGLEAPAAT